MKKLNNRGITTVEILICFVLVVMITVSMYSTISTFNERRLIESYKSKVYTYKNLLTKEIQDDFIKVGLTHATHTRKTNGAKVTYTVNCELRDGSKKQLIIEQQLAKSEYHIGGYDGVNDEFMIKYGSPDDLMNYPLPNLGESEARNPAYKTKDLSINNVLINISKSNILSIHIGFYHPELGTRYSIDIIAPINYISMGIDPANSDFA